MAFSEFINLMNASGLITDEFPERDAITSFSLSMMTQVDEFDSNKHMKMQKVEFFETIARAAESLSMAPPGSLSEEWPIERRKNQSLAEKMDNIIPNLITATKKEFKERFKRPDRDRNTGLYLTAPEFVLKENQTELNMTLS